MLVLSSSVSKQTHNKISELLCLNSSVCPPETSFEMYRNRSYFQKKEWQRVNPFL